MSNSNFNFYYKNDQQKPNALLFIQISDKELKF